MLANSTSTNNPKRSSLKISEKKSLFKFVLSVDSHTQSDLNKDMKYMKIPVTHKNQRIT